MTWIEFGEKEMINLALVEQVAIVTNRDKSSWGVRLRTISDNEYEEFGTGQQAQARYEELKAFLVGGEPKKNELEQQLKKLIARYKKDYEVLKVNVLDGNTNPLTPTDLVYKGKAWKLEEVISDLEELILAGIITDEDIPVRPEVSE